MTTMTIKTRIVEGGPWRETTSPGYPSVAELRKELRRRNALRSPECREEMTDIPGGLAIYDPRARISQEVTQDDAD